MSQPAIKLSNQKSQTFMGKVKELLPDGGNLNLCLTCGACSSGCPATGLIGMDPRKFLRMAALGMDQEIAASDWPWMCTMCRRCVHACPMGVDIPQLVYYCRQSCGPGRNAPRASSAPASMALSNARQQRHGYALQRGLQVFVVEDVAGGGTGRPSPALENLQVPIDKEGRVTIS